MSPRTTEQYDKIRQERKGSIMNAALDLFAEQGYHATSISQIAKKAGISKGLTYNYFESKKDILDELINHGFDTIFESFDLNHDGILTEEEFVHFIKHNFEILRENMEHWKLFFSLLLQPSISGNFSKDYKEKGEPFFSMLYNFLISKGSTDPKGDVMVISAMLEGAFLYTVIAPEVFPLQLMEDKVINACFRLISTNKSKTSK